MGRLKQLLIGEPLKNEALSHEKYSIFWGLPILSSDAISSVAYAVEEILLVLVPIVGLLAFHTQLYISMAIVMLLALLTFSYRQTIQSYPDGGGSYIVASDNLGKYAGVAAGSSLAIDYILTVAVSISSGTAAIISAFPHLLPYRVEICVVILLLLFLGNLRGIRESAVLFGLPAYAFMLSMFALILVGVGKVFLGGYHPPIPQIHQQTGLEAMSMFLILRAFSSGCAALTGVEAVSNAVPNFRDPAPKHARQVLLLLSLVVFLIFGGISLLASLYPVQMVEGKTVLSLITAEVFGNSPMYFVIQATTAVILALAANTAFADFPMLFSVMARDGYAPRQLAMRGARLGYSNGITVLTFAAALLLVIFQGDTHKLIPLYAVGVFTSFTLSQGGMFVKWVRQRKTDKKWRHKAVINGTGALVTLVTVFIIGITKFTHGAWIVIVIVPIFMLGFLKVKKHYLAVAEQLRVSPEEIASLDLSCATYRNHVIVPVESLNKASIRALRYARTISNDIVAFNVSLNEEAKQKIEEKWSRLKTDIPLVVNYSPYRKVVEPLLEYVESYEANSYQKGDMITVILPQFSVRTWWHIFLHNQSRLFISKDLLKHKHIVVATIPLQLKDDESVLKKCNLKK